MICFSGNREGLDDAEGHQELREGLKQLMPLGRKTEKSTSDGIAQQQSRSQGLHCDHTAWGVELVKAVGSERFKLLYDIYHMQIMEGDVIARSSKYKEYIAHYHTGGVPGRKKSTTRKN